MSSFLRLRLSELSASRRARALVGTLSFTGAPKTIKKRGSYILALLLVVRPKTRLIPETMVL